MMNKNFGSKQVHLKPYWSILHNWRNIINYVRNLIGIELPITEERSRATGHKAHVAGPLDWSKDSYVEPQYVVFDP